MEETFFGITTTLLPTVNGICRLIRSWFGLLSSRGGEEEALHIRERRAVGTTPCFPRRDDSNWRTPSFPPPPAEGKNLRQLKEALRQFRQQRAESGVDPSKPSAKPHPHLNMR